MFGPFQPGDSLRVYRLQGRGVALDLQRALTEAHAPLREAWLAFVTQQAMGRATYVLYDAQHGEAFVQVQYRPHQAAADVAYLAPGLGESATAAAAWTQMLDGVGIEIAARGIQRLFGSLPEPGAGLDIFQQAGFAVYARDDVYRLSQPANAAPAATPAGLRPRSAEDWPALQKLCVAVTPQRVRQAEGGIDMALTWGRRLQAYVVAANPDGNDDDLLATVSIYLGGLAHWLRIIVRPDVSDLAFEVARWAVTRLAGLPPRPIYCNVRQYEAGMREPLLSAGFELDHTRTLVVKQTLAYVKVPTQELVPALKGTAEPVPPAFRSSQSPVAGGRQPAVSHELQADH